ncbi:hypothetical protein GJ496_006587 [Pomphorhynchus laevis]|nr:hypothetical protein GJ496_006587 [Pomphorhynchus laevis]
MERENDSDDNAEEINDIQSEDYETLLDVTEEWGMRRRLNEANEEDMREQRQLRGLLEIDTREDRTDLVTINPKEAECIIEDFNEIEFGKELLMDLNEESISNKLYTAWNRLIPCLYNWPLAATGKIDRGVDRNIDKLITPLKILMSGNPDWQNDWKSFCSPNKRTVCGKMFKTDGIVYQCWTCSTDPTTVLCSECFMHSEHRNHSYRMASSGGGGFCDCGDVESWVSFPHCSIHKPDDSDSTGRCSDEIKSRIRTVIGAVFRICVEALSWTNFEALPSYITDSREEYDRIFATVVLNDEIHSYMEVTTCLSSTLEVSRSQAYDLANMIDKEGRTTVCVGKRSRCINMKKYIDVTMSVSRLPPILTVVIPTMLLSHQEFCIDVLHQIQKWIAESEIIREAFCIAASKPRECDKSLLESILLLDDVLWKSSRALLHKILVNCFLEPEWKIVFSNAYIKNYPEIIKQYLNSKDESLSFAELSVQLLTTPSIAAHLLINKDALKVISDTFLAELQDYKRDGNISFDNLSVSKVYRLRKTLRILADIRYILSAPSPSTDINEIGKGVISGSTSIVLILTTMQGMNSCRRATLIHVQNEPEWETAFNITMRMIASIRLLLGYTRRTSNLAIQFLNQITYALAIEAGAHRAWEVANLLNHQANCIKYDILQDPVSVHYPLSRLLVGALLNCLDHSDIKSIISKFGCLHPVWIFEHSLRVRVLTSQSIASLWKRNGLSLHDQLVLISSSRCRAEMADRDIMALQVGAAVLDPNEFLLHVMNRYKILTWLSEESLYAHRGSYDNYTYKQLALIVEEFFDLIFQILLERYHPSIGFSDWQTMLQRDMIHSLCCKNQAHNELFKDIDDPDDRKNFDNFTQTFDEILNEIAEVRKSGPSKVQYILKSEYEAMLNPYSAHLSRADRNHIQTIVKNPNSEFAVVILCLLFFKPNVRYLRSKYLPDSI